jgi:ribosomal protein S1
MEINQVHTGHIVRLSNEKTYGFIEEENGELYFFHALTEKKQQKKLKQEGLLPSIQNYISGDQVSFKLRSSQKENYKLEAYDVKFLANKGRHELINEFQKNNILYGYIKIIDSNKLFVKHIATYIHLPILISDWEEKKDEVYINRENKLVGFRLNQTVKTDKLVAILTDAKFIDEYYILMSHFDNQTTLQAVITGKNKNGYYALLFEGKIEGFIKYIFNSSTIKGDSFSQFKKGDLVTVRIKHRLQTQMKVSLAFANDSLK